VCENFLFTPSSHQLCLNRDVDCDCISFLVFN
jgi:hypothetical protein